ncbi:MAG: flagellar brake protein [Gammaproteobacteria bacterium]|nr:flagellar brake protein [Gammaproteobacteria bacterium]
MNIFQKLGELTSGSRAYQEVVRELERLRITGKPVTVRFEGEKQTFSSRITAFNQEHRVFVLDNLFPSVHDNTFSKGRTVSISCTDNQKSISLSGVCIAPLVKGAEMGYELKVSSSLTVEEFARDFDFGLQHARNSVSSIPERKVVGL